MVKSNRYLSVSFIKTGFLGLLPVLVMLFFLTAEAATAVLAGYCLSFLFVGSNWIVIRRLYSGESPQFYRRYLRLLLIRFASIIGLLMLILGVTKIDQIFFTVSFIISYIFHSVIEIIFIQKILENENRK
jgi:hypothetical protein